ncbi:MAG TPA: DEAD/DEAH box helicase [Pyrinomonadaceae bacterium]
MPRQRVNNRRKRRDPKEENRERRDGRRQPGEKLQQRRSGVDSSTPQRSNTQTRELRRLLEGIGTPPPAPFKPDPFQLAALAALEYEDVLVTAPTGSGKTWIAREEIRRLLAQGKRAWYTSPLKALTNSKYQEFIAEFGAERVGILTGDRKENADAPLVVGTTEIYRNQLFDSLRSGTNIRADLVVLDEAHYLADEERGHVWEEAIILSPPRVRLLLLSATIGNAEEFAAWIGEVRGVRCGVVERPGARPVPLRSAFLYPDGQLIPLLNDAGKLHQEIVRLGEQQEKQRQERSSQRDWRSRRRMKN